MAAHRTALKAVQEQDRVKTPVEEWIGSLTPLHAFLRGRDELSTTELHDEFLEFERTRFPAMRGTSVQAFGREMRKLAGKPGGRFNLVLINSGSNSAYTWKG
jgi:hypothetical protein